MVTSLYGEQLSYLLDGLLYCQLLGCIVAAMPSWLTMGGQTALMANCS